MCHNRKCREISNPEANLQLIAPPAHWELFKSRFAKARKMNSLLQPPRYAVGWKLSLGRLAFRLPTLFARMLLKKPLRQALKGSKETVFIKTDEKAKDDENYAMLCG